MVIDAYMNETVKLLVPNPPGDFMEKTPPTEVEILARVNWINKLVKNAEGEEVMSAVNIDIDNDTSIYYDHKLEIQNVKFSIIKIDRVQDFSAQYLKIYLS